MRPLLTRILSVWWNRSSFKLPCYLMGWHAGRATTGRPRYTPRVWYCHRLWPVDVLPCGSRAILGVHWQTLHPRIRYDVPEVLAGMASPGTFPYVKPYMAHGYALVVGFNVYCPAGNSCGRR